MCTSTILCFAGQLSRRIREWHLSISLYYYKLTDFVSCSITELSTYSHCLFTLSDGQLTCKTQYIKSYVYHITCNRYSMAGSAIMAYTCSHKPEGEGLYEPDSTNLPCYNYALYIRNFSHNKSKNSS